MPVFTITKCSCDVIGCKKEDSDTKVELETRGWNLTAGGYCYCPEHNQEYQQLVLNNNNALNDMLSDQQMKFDLWRAGKIS